MNIVEIIEKLPHLNMIIYFDELTPIQQNKLNTFKNLNRVKVKSFKQLHVSIFRNILKFILFEYP